MESEIENFLRTLPFILSEPIALFALRLLNTLLTRDLPKSISDSPLLVQSTLMSNMFHIQ